MTAASTPASEPVSASGVDTPPEPGRPIELVPMRPGSWWLLLGGGFALLGPLFGFLVGSAIGPGEQSAGLSPLQLALFAGFAVGGLGVLAALNGARRLYRDSRTTTPAA